MNISNIMINIMPCVFFVISLTLSTFICPFSVMFITSWYVNMPIVKWALFLEAFPRVVLVVWVMFGTLLYESRYLVMGLHLSAVINVLSVFRMTIALIDVSLHGWTYGCIVVSQSAFDMIYTRFVTWILARFLRDDFDIVVHGPWTFLHPVLYPTLISQGLPHFGQPAVNNTIQGNQFREDVPPPLPPTPPIPPQESYQLQSIPENLSLERRAAESSSQETETSLEIITERSSKDDQSTSSEVKKLKEVLSAAKFEAWKGRILAKS